MLKRIFIVGLIVICGCTTAPESVVPKFDPASAATKAIELFDANKTGTIEGTELDKSPGLKAGLARIDTNRDQAISKEELVSRISSYVKDGIAVQPVNINIKLDDKPLSGVTVTLVPEAFLIPPLKSATATTDFGGSVVPKVEGLNISAVYLGLYRVEITGKTAQGQDIPAKFNSETTLGLEVALDVPEFERGINFSISSR